MSSGVTKINDSAFSGCVNLSELDFSQCNDLLSIGAYAFRGCTSLYDIKFGENSTKKTIGAYAFADCTNLLTAEMPKNISSFGVYPKGQFIITR
jgi:hypothetical protein